MVADLFFVWKAYYSKYKLETEQNLLKGTF